jgi:hypothetical protein
MSQERLHEPESLSSSRGPGHSERARVELRGIARNHIRNSGCIVPSNPMSQCWLVPALEAGRGESAEDQSAGHETAELDHRGWG